MATHPSILAWRIPCSEEPGRLQSVGSHMHAIVQCVYVPHLLYPLPVDGHVG